MADGLETVARGVFLKAVNTKPLKDGRTVWDCITHDNTSWGTLQPKLGNKAEGLVGEFVDIKGTIKQNGNFTNTYLNDIQKATGEITPAAQAAAKAQAAQPATQSAEVTYGEYKDLEAAKTTSIHRQTATKVAAVLVGPEGSVADFWANVEAIENFYKTGLNPMDADKLNTEQGDMSPQSDPEVPEEDDIPF